MEERRGVVRIICIVFKVELVLVLFPAPLHVISSSHTAQGTSRYWPRNQSVLATMQTRVRMRRTHAAMPHTRCSGAYTHAFARQGTRTSGAQKGRMAWHQPGREGGWSTYKGPLGRRCSTATICCSACSTRSTPPALCAECCECCADRTACAVWRGVSAAGCRTSTSQESRSSRHSTSASVVLPRTTLAASSWCACTQEQRGKSACPRRVQTPQSAGIVTDESKHLNQPRPCACACEKAAQGAAQKDYLRKTI